MTSPLWPQLTSLYANDSMRLSDVLICNSLANRWGALQLPWCRSAGAAWYQDGFYRQQVDSRTVGFLSCHLHLHHLAVSTSCVQLPHVATPGQSVWRGRNTSFRPQIETQTKKHHCQVSNRNKFVIQCRADIFRGQLSRPEFSTLLSLSFIKKNKLH